MHPELQQYLDGHPHWSPATRAAHRRWLEEFLALDPQPDLVGFQQRLLWRSVGGRLYSSNTIDQALRVVRSFCRWAHQVGLRASDPTAGLALPRPIQPLQPILSREQLLALLNQPNLGRPQGLRDLVLLELLYYSQLSMAACISLPLDHCLELETSTATAIRQYLFHSRPQLLRVQTDRLLLTSRGQPFVTEGGTRAILRGYQQKLRLPFPLSASLLHRSWRAHVRQLRRRHF